MHTDGLAATGGAERGFRKGLLPLRDMKMAWTLQEFTAMDDRYNFKIKRQDASFVGKGGVQLENAAVGDFQNYLRRFQFQQQRFGYLYGRYVDEEEEPEKEKESIQPERVSSEWGARMPQGEKAKRKKNAKVIVEGALNDCLALE